MKSKILFKKGILFLGIAFLLFGCISKTNSPGKNRAEKFTPHPIIKEHQDVTTLAIGAKAPDFTLPDINGIYVSLKDFNKSDILVIVFTCNHCPTAQAYEDRIISFTSDYSKKGVQVVAIMPNSCAGLLLEECDYSDLDDAFENMAIRAKDKGFNFPYLYDGDDQAVAIKYGPTTTPHAFVFDKNRILQYAGRIDAHEKPGTGNGEDLRQAVDELLAGKPVTTPVNKTFGCSVKWSWKSEWAQKVNKDWNDKPVSIEPIDNNSIKELLSNKTGKLLLVDVWASWCGPCVLELPELVKLQRMYGTKRKFEFVTLSADKLAKEEEALSVLKSKNLPIRNFIFIGDDQYKLVDIVDPEWNGALPYMLLIEPGGKVIYKNQGLIDMLELKKKIVEHPLLGRYY
jgi:thiol-disulfide isomerase/thioredoxin